MLSPRLMNTEGSDEFQRQTPRPFLNYVAAPPKSAPEAAGAAVHMPAPVVQPTPTPPVEPSSPAPQATKQGLKAKIVELATSAKGKAEMGLDEARGFLGNLKTKLELRKVQAMAAVSGLYENVCARVTSSKVFLVSYKYATSLQVIASKQYEVLRSQGIKAWTGQAMITGKKSLDVMKSTAGAAYSRKRQSALELIEGTRTSASAVASAAQKRAQSTAELAMKKASEAKTSAKTIASDGKFQATAAGAAGGVATLGASGAVTGLAAGSALGAAIGFIPAIFTFGLSIPIGAALGGGSGLVVGAAAGAATGAVGGGAAGYGVYSKRSEIKEGTQKTLAKINSGADFVKGKAKQSAGFVKGKVSAVRSRLPGTGGTN